MIPSTSIPNYSSHSNQHSFLPQNHPQTLPNPSHTLHQGADPNSPDIFIQNIHIVHENVMRLQRLASSALVGMYVCDYLFCMIHGIKHATRQNAYHPGSNPAQTEGALPFSQSNLCILIDLHFQWISLPLNRHFNSFLTYCDIVVSAPSHFFRSHSQILKPSLRQQSNN